MNNDDDSIVIIIPKYPRSYGNPLPKYYTINNNVAGVYSRTGKKQKPLPKKLNPDYNAQYQWKLRGNVKKPTLYDIVNCKYVVANEEEVANGHQIKAQKSNMNNRMHDGIRKQIFKTIKDACRLHLRAAKRVPNDWYPVRIDIALHDTVDNPFDNKDVLKQRWDCDNLCSIYQKSVLDLLHEEGVILDDDRFYASLPICYWRPLNVENHDHRFIKITIRPDLYARENDVYKRFFNRVPLKPNKLEPQGKLF